MISHKNKKISLFYIIVLLLSFICNVQTKVFNEKIKRIVSLRNDDDVLLMQAASG